MTRQTVTSDVTGKGKGEKKTTKEVKYVCGPGKGLQHSVHAVGMWRDSVRLVRWLK